MGNIFSKKNPEVVADDKCKELREVVSPAVVIDTTKHTCGRDIPKKETDAMSNSLAETEEVIIKHKDELSKFTFFCFKLVSAVGKISLRTSSIAADVSNFISGNTIKIQEHPDEESLGLEDTKQLENKEDLKKEKKEDLEDGDESDETSELEKGINDILVIADHPEELPTASLNFA
uniref:Protein Ycf2-like n=1 Tax=Rhabditophanes sp. KR3021 TaxID=114890 RepID=A0AC35TFM5_9BILA